MRKPATAGADTFDQADFVIVTALEKEAQAVVRRLENCHIERFEDRDIRTYHCGLVPVQDGDRAYRVVVVSLPSMGEIAAANAVTDAVTRWRPRFVLMVGIAGGIPQDDLDLGDVVVADQVVGYEYGKMTDKGIKPRDHVYPASALLLDRVRSFWDEDWTEQIDVARPENANRTASKRFVGPIASGNKVIASTKFREQLLTHWPKLIAVEMEAEGVYAAVFDRPQILGTLIIRGICDMADERKSDAWQEYAANAAATYAIAFLRDGPVEPGAPSIPPTLEPIKLSLAKLPSTSPDLFGRDGELATLDSAWENPAANVLTFVAWGGVGKTALVNKWLLGMKDDDYRGARRVYGWSFYSQGAAEGRQTSADPFIDAALRWFGDPDPTAGSPWDKGDRLAELVCRERTLLVLDGLEPLQYPPGEMEGRLKDPGLQCLLRGLARHNPGLCVLTTRLEVDDLKDFVGTSVVRIHLEHLTPQAGAQVLRTQGAQGSDAEMEQAARDFGGHALALTLLGSLLRDVYGGDVRRRSEVGPLEGELRQGGHARRVIVSYERWLGQGPGLAILRLLGLFDRPAKGDEIGALRAEPPIAGLTDALQDLSERDWRLALAKLRRARLLAERDPAQPDALDAHPLVREHFGAQLRQEHPEAWREGNARLYEHLKATVPHQPDTLEEMLPLYAAVAHGCRAGRYQEAYDEVYRERIRRWNEHFGLTILGAVGVELVTLSNFFALPWRHLVNDLGEHTKGICLNQTGFCLCALGRLAEAAQPMQAGLEAAIQQEDWRNAARAAENLRSLRGERRSCPGPAIC
jgi:nucleoside phosphorylase